MTLSMFNNTNKILKFNCLSGPLPELDIHLVTFPAFIPYIHPTNDSDMKKNRALVGLIFALPFWLFGQNLEGVLGISGTQLPEMVRFHLKGKKALWAEHSDPQRVGQVIRIDFEKEKIAISSAQSGHGKILQFDLSENPKGELLHPLAEAPAPYPSFPKLTFTKKNEKAKLGDWNCQIYTAISDSGAYECLVTEDWTYPVAQLEALTILSGAFTQGLPRELPGTLVGLTYSPKKTGKPISFQVEFDRKSQDNGDFSPGSEAKIIDISGMRRRLKAADNDPEKLKQILSEL